MLIKAKPPDCATSASRLSIPYKGSSRSRLTMLPHPPLTFWSSQPSPANSHRSSQIMSEGHSLQTVYAGAQLQCREGSQPLFKAVSARCPCSMPCSVSLIFCMAAVLAELYKQAVGVSRCSMGFVCIWYAVVWWWVCMLDAGSR